MASLTLAEMETVIQYDRASDVAQVYTHDQALMRSIEGRKIKPMAEHIYEGRVVAKSYRVPKDMLSVGLKPKRSAAQVAASREAGKRLAEREKAKKLLASGKGTTPAGISHASGAGRGPK